MKSNRVGYLSRSNEKSAALVLCGGGGKGAFQIGAWKALEEHGIMDHVKAISGTSVGALNAVLFALGDRKMAEDIWKNIKPEDMLSPDVDPDNLCLFSRDGMKKILKNVPLEKLRESDIDVYITVRNKTLDRIEEKHINKLPRSEMEKILLATSAIPVAYPEVEIGGYSYEDAGGIELYNTPIYSAYNHGYRNIYILSLNYLFSIHSIDNGETKIDADKLYEGCSYTVIKPFKDLGGVFEGALNFQQLKIRELLWEGYSTTKRTLEGEFRYIMAPMFQAPAHVTASIILAKLITENFKTAEELRKFVNFSGMKCSRGVLATKNGGKIHWSVIATVGEIEVQHHTTLHRSWNHYRFIETYRDEKGQLKKRCILSTFDVLQLIDAIEKYLKLI